MLSRSDSASWPLAAAPEHVAGTLGQVFPVAARALGRDLVSGGQLPDLLQGTAPGSLRGVVVLLVDGLGAKLLREQTAYLRFLRKSVPTACTLHTSFPSTTTTALAYLGTGQLAGATGMAGYTARNPETGKLAQFIKWEELPSPEQWQTAPQYLQLFERAGGQVSRVGQKKFAASDLSRAMLWTDTYHLAHRGPERVTAALNAVGRGTKDRPALVYLYWGELDKIGHRHGTDSFEWGQALSDLDGTVADLVNGLPKGTGLLLTADHGMIRPNLAAQIDIASEPQLNQGLTLVGGEPRALHLYCAPEDAPEVAARWRNRLEHRAQVFTRAEAVDQGWFGQVRPEIAGALGEVVVAMTEDFTVVDSRIHTPEARALLGVHGSLTAAETEVPLLWFAK